MQPWILKNQGCLGIRIAAKVLGWFSTVWIVNANRRNLVELTQRSLKQLVIIRGDDEPEIDFGQCANKS